MLRLGINIDHIATIRNARHRHTAAAPDIARAAQQAIKGGADSITVHLREDRRHILDEDIKRLRRILKKPINLEIAATPEMVKIALTIKPGAVCIVPEKRAEITTEGGLDVVKGGAKLARIVHELTAAGIRVALFVNPEATQIKAARNCGAAAVELHTGAYADAKGAKQRAAIKQLQRAARQAQKLGLEVHAGHGLTYDNVPAIAAIPEIIELNIGHFLVGEALFIGLAAAVKKMRGVMHQIRRKNVALPHQSLKTP